MHALVVESSGRRTRVSVAAINGYSRLRSANALLQRSSADQPGVLRSLGGPDDPAFRDASLTRRLKDSTRAHDHWTSGGQPHGS